MRRYIRAMDRMMLPRKKFTTCFSYVALCVATMSCLFNTNPSWKFGNTALLITFFYGIFGAWRYGRYDSYRSVDKITEYLSYIVTLYSIASTLVDFYISYAFDSVLAIMHLIYPLVALIPYLKCGMANRELLDICSFISCFSLCIISLLEGNAWGLAGCITFVLTHFYITHRGKTFNMPSLDFYNYGLCLFWYLMLQAVRENLLIEYQH